MFTFTSAASKLSSKRSTISPCSVIMVDSRSNMFPCVFTHTHRLPVLSCGLRCPARPVHVRVDSRLRSHHSSGWQTSSIPTVNPSHHAYRRRCGDQRSLLIAHVHRSGLALRRRHKQHVSRLVHDRLAQEIRCRTTESLSSLVRLLKVLVTNFQHSPKILCCVHQLFF